jgi:hypothetical protein
VPNLLKGGGGAGVKSTLGWTIPTTIAGVATGFLVVAGLWAVALVAGLVFSALLAPEAARRSTLKTLYSADTGTFAWRAGRVWWARLSLARLGAGWRIADVRWPDLAVAWGEDTQVMGFLPVLVRQGEQLPAGAESTYPEDQYEVYRWARERPAPDSATANVLSQAHVLARLWTDGFVSACTAAGRAIGDSNAARPVPCGLLIADGAGLTTGFVAEQQAATDPMPTVQAQQLLFLQGVVDGLSYVRRAAFGVGGKFLLSPNDGQTMAADIAQWANPQLQLSSEGRWLRVGDERVLEVNVTPDSKLTWNLAPLTAAEAGRNVR